MKKVRKEDMYKSLIIHLFFFNLFFINYTYASSQCKNECYKNIDQICKSCVDYSSNSITPREYYTIIETETLKSSLPEVLNSPKAKKIFEKAKKNLFKKWKVNPKKPLPKTFKNGRGIIIENKDGTLDISLNSQLAHELLRISKGNEKIIKLAENTLQITTAGDRIEAAYRRSLQENFDKIKGDSNSEFSVCYQNTTRMNQTDKANCIQAKQLADNIYFSGRPFSYVYANEHFNPSMQQSISQNTSTIWDAKDEGVQTKTNYLQQCYAETNNLFPKIIPGQNCEQKGLAEFANQLEEVENFSASPQARYFDLLRIEAIRQLMLTYSNATGELPSRDSIKNCEKPFSQSLDNIYEKSAKEFNPSISERELNPQIIADRNREIIHRLIALSQKAKVLNEVNKQDCYVYVGESDICVETDIWKKNKPLYEKITAQIQTLLNEFPLLGSLISRDQLLYSQILKDDSSLKSLLKNSDKEIFRQRELVIKKNLEDSINRFCGNENDSITEKQLIIMKSLRQSMLDSFPHHNLGQLDICLEHSFKRQEEKESNEQTAYALGCAGLSFAAGVVTWYAGGYGAVATAIGLGCFGAETSTMYENFVRSGIEEENIHACFISSPDMEDKKVQELCSNETWHESKKRYEQALSSLKLQAALSPLEIFPVISDLRNFKKTRSNINALLNERDELIDLGEEAKKLGNKKEVRRIEKEIKKGEEKLKTTGVTDEDVQNFYQSKIISKNSTNDSAKIDLSEAPTLNPSNSIMGVTPSGEIMGMDLSRSVSNLDPSEAITPIGIYRDQILPPKKPNSLGSKPTLKPDLHSSPDQLIREIQKSLGGFQYQELNTLKTLPRTVLSNIELLIKISPDYKNFTRKLLNSNYSHRKGYLPLTTVEIDGITSELIRFYKRDSASTDRFVSQFLSNQMTAHDLGPVLRHCNAKANCEEIVLQLENRLNLPTITKEEKLLLERNSASYLGHYLPTATENPLGAFIGQGGYGAVFCRGNKTPCEEIVKIPLNYFSDEVIKTERELAELYIKHGDRAAEIYSPKGKPILIKEFIGGKEAYHYLNDGAKYSQQQQDDLVQLFADLHESSKENRKVIFADVKANNIKWDPKRNKWVFIDTGTRPIPRRMFDNVDEFFEAFGIELFFPTWVKQTPDQIAHSKIMWTEVCQKMIAQLEDSKKSILAPACEMVPK